ncbi:MAG: hypothetical protein ACJAS1_004725 [Oleiphilaceae bacterium]|jgi:hypothetical protein
MNNAVGISQTEAQAPSSLSKRQSMLFLPELNA